MSSILFFCIFFLHNISISSPNHSFVITHASGFNGAYERILSRDGYLVGGLPRLHHYIRDTFFILAGDLIRKSLTSRPHRLYVDQEVLAFLGPSVYVLGSSELELMPETYRLIANQSQLAIGSVNIELPLTKSEIELKGTNIIVLGYSPPGNYYYPLTTMYGVPIYDPVESLTKKIESIKAERNGTYTYVAAGCAGHEVALKIAQSVEDIDIVISGCSNFMQWNEGEPPENLPINSTYPVVIEGKTGKKVRVAHSSGSTRFVGKIQIDTDEDMNITSIHGDMVYLDHTLPEDEEIKKIIAKIRLIELAQTRVFLNGNCERNECNLGNLIADSFVEYKSVNFKGNSWTDTPIGLVLSGNIETSINATTSSGVILVEHLLYIFPRYRRLVTVELSGLNIRQVLEQTFEDYEEQRGMFLQVSGLQVTYDRRRPFGQRFGRVLVKCSNCDIPSYSAIKLTKKYRVVTTADMLKGAFGQTRFANTSKKIKVENMTDYHALRMYLLAKKHVNIGREERIRIVPSTNGRTRLYAMLEKILAVMACAVFFRSCRAKI